VQAALASFLPPEARRCRLTRCKTPSKCLYLSALTLHCDKLLSSWAINFNLRRYSECIHLDAAFDTVEVLELADGGARHSFPR